MRLPRMTTRRWMIVILAIGCALGWALSAARVQRTAVATIQRAGGRVWYDWECQNGRPIPNARPWWPKLLVNLVGPDQLSNVVRVELTRGASDTELIQIGRLNRLEVLFLSGFSVTDAGLAHLQSLNRLKALRLGAGKVGDAGLAHLSGSQNLQELSLSIGPVTELGLVHLKGLPRLKLVRFWFANHNVLHLKAEWEAIRKTLPNAYNAGAINYGAKLM